MAIQVSCPKSGCGKVFRLKDELAGKKVKCSACGTIIEVSAAVGAEAPSGGKSGAQPPRHPGVAQVGKRQKQGIPVLPLVIGGAVAVVIIVVLVFGGIWVAKSLKERARKREEAEQAQVAEAEESTGEESAGPAEPEIEGRPAPVPESELGVVSEEEQNLREATEAYAEELTNVMKDLRSASPEEMAARWAKLYEYCEEKGLETEAERAWFRAVFLNPSASATNKILGRTETFEGEPVTPEQQKFLETLVPPTLEVMNYNPYAPSMQVSVEGSPPTTLRRGRSARFRARKPIVTIKADYGAGAAGKPMEFDVPVAHGFDYTIRIQAPIGLARVPLSDVKLFYKGWQELQQAMRADGTLIEDRLQEGGWVQEGQSWKKGFEISIPSGPAMGGGRYDGPPPGMIAPEPIPFTARLDSQQKVIEVQLGALTLSRTARGALYVQGQGNTCRVIGVLAVGEVQHLAGRPHVVHYGTAEQPIEITAESRQSAALVSGGLQYSIDEQIAEPLLNIFATIDGDVAGWRKAKRITEEKKTLKDEYEYMEAEGELLGGWHAAIRLANRTGELGAKAGAELEIQDAAAKLGDHADKAKALGLSDRGVYLYLNYPRFRRALAAALAPDADKLFKALETLCKLQPVEIDLTDEEPQGGMDSQEMRQMMRRMGPLARRSRDTDAPELSEKQGLLLRLRLLRVFPAEFALQTVNRMWNSLDLESKTAAMRSLAAIGGPEIVAFLGKQSERSGDEEVVIQALLCLGKIGTSDAMSYLDNPAVLPGIRAARLAAFCLAGDLQYINSLQEKLDEGESEMREKFPYFLDDMASAPAMHAWRKAIDYYGEGEANAQIAWMLARMSGESSMYLINRLLEKGGEIYPYMLERIRPSEAILLVRSMGEMLRKGQGDPMAAARLLAGTGRSDAFLQLKAAVVNARRPEGLVGLAQIGSKEAFQVAAKMPDVLDFQSLKEIFEDWRGDDAPEGVLQLRDGVDRAGAVEFLKMALVYNRDWKVKLAAAKMLIDIGAKPDAASLFALASGPALSTEKPKRARRRVVFTTGPQGMMGPGMMAPQTQHDYKSAPPGSWRQRPEPEMPTFAPGSRRSAREAEEGPLTFAGDPRLVALQFLIKAPDRSILEGLETLVDTSTETSLRAEAMKVIASIGGEEAVDFLRQKVATIGSEADLQEALANLDFQIGAVVALAMTSQQEAATILFDLYGLTPPEEIGVPAEGAPGAETATGSGPDRFALRPGELPPGEYDAGRGGRGGPQYEPPPPEAPAPLQWEMRVRAAASMGFFELGRERKLNEILTDRDFHTRLMERLIRYVDQPGPPDVAGAGELLAQVKASSVRALGRLGGLTHGAEVVLLNRLALQFEERPAPRRRRAIGPSYMVGPATGNTSQEPERQPQIVNKALLHAIVDMAEDIFEPEAIRTTLEKLPGVLAKDKELQAVWNELAPRLADKASPGAFALLNYTHEFLTSSTLKKLVEVTDTKPAASLGLGYYQFLARTAARASVTGPTYAGLQDMPPMFMGPGGPGEYYQQPSAPQLRNAAERVLHWQNALRRVLEWDVPNPQMDRWVEDMRFRYGCLQRIERGPSPLASAALSDEDIGLLENTTLGPAAALVLGQKSPEFDVAGHLKSLVTEDEAMSEQMIAMRQVARGPQVSVRNVVAAARRLAGAGGKDVLQHILHPPEMERTTGGGGAATQIQRQLAMEMGTAGQTQRSAEDSLRERIYAARALGSMGALDVLQQGAAKTKEVAFEGYVYLPPQRDPVGLLTAAKRASRVRLSATRRRRGAADKREKIDDLIEKAYRILMKRFTEAES